MTESLDQLPPETIAARLAGSPGERAALIREGAEAGVAEAQAVYGQMLLDRGEPEQGFGWFNKAAAQGHLMALNMVGRCYDLGWGTPVDKRRAGECFRIAAERGLDWAMYNYATALALGDGVTEDKPGALAWFEKAAALGNAKAVNHVGSFHEDGWVVPRDMARAADCYARAAEGGDFRGAFNHARMLLAEGRADEAREWLGRSVATGTPAFAEKVERWLADHGHAELAEAVRA
ncbi:MAG: tetratricopeptide repeat protein [Pseudomonadota bacterium]